MSIKKNILLVGNFLSAKGGNRTIGEDLAEHLGGAGYSIIKTSSLRSRPFRLLDMLFTVLAQKRRYSLACIEVYSGAAFFWAEMVCRVLAVLRKPYILTLHGGNLPAFAHFWPKRVSHLLSSAAITVAPSRYLQEKMSLYRSDIRLLPNPLAVHCYPFRQRVKPELRLIWLRAFHQIYHPQMAVEVVARLQTIFSDIHLTMIGPDKGDGALQETQTLIEKLDLKKNVEVIPGIPKSEVPDCLQQADIFINTTNVDNTPVSVIEAMACGLCIVSTNVGGIPYLLDHEQNALLVPPNDPDGMSIAVRCILEEPGLAARLSQNARKEAESFDWSAVLPQWEQLFQEILAR